MLAINARIPTLKSICSVAVTVALTVMSAQARAQSSVQLYGIVDAWAGYLRIPGQSAAAQVGGGGLSTSFWGFRGQEDLGGGYKAMFVIEGFFRPQTGQSGSFNGDPMFSRNAYVGIGSPYGALTLGRQSSLLYLQSAQFNPFYASFTFSPTINQLYSALGTYPGYRINQGIPGGTSWSNAIQYATPDFSGLNAHVMYAFGNQAGDDAAKKVSAQATWTHGYFAMGATWQYLNFGTTPGDLNNLVRGFQSQTAMQLGMSYNFNFVKLYGEYTYADNELITSSFHVNMLQGGLSVPVGVGSILASYAWSRDNSNLNQARQTATLSYDYPFSKRTDVYVGYMYDHVSRLSSGYTAGAGIRTRF